MRDKERTPPSTLTNARNIALESGINFCYTGNVYNREGQTTYCPGCRSKLIERDWHSVLTNNMYGNSCPSCGTVIPGEFFN
jgi:pyruvate formate lyase activating enzyme